MFSVLPTVSKVLKVLSRNSFQVLLVTFYLHTYVVIEQVLTPNTLFFHLLKNGKKNLDCKDYTGTVLMELSKVCDTIDSFMAEVSII